MKYLFERMEEPLTEWNANDQISAIQRQVQRIAEGHRLVKDESALDLIGLELGSGNEVGTVVDLGASAGQSHIRFAKQMERLLLRFEPRILRPKVSVLPSSKGAFQANLLIEGQLQHSDELEEFRFSIELAD